MDFTPGPEIVFQYFPNLTSRQKGQFLALGDLFTYWNQKINVISRKDMGSFYQNHVLHSLGIAKVQIFQQSDVVLDVGTGGGFPGIPLSILFPKTHFHLIDSIGKKIKVVGEIISDLGLVNTSCEQIRAEQVTESYNFIVCRAVTRLNRLISWVRPNLLKHGKVLCLKGGDLQEEINEAAAQVKIQELSKYFHEPFFESKKVLRIRSL